MKFARKFALSITAGQVKHCCRHINMHTTKFTKKSVRIQARTQTFEKGGANLMFFFTKGGANLKKILILKPKLGV